MKQHPEPVPDFTNAFLAMAWGILFMAFWTIASIFGFLWVALSATAIDVVLRRLRLRRSDLPADVLGQDR